MKLNTDLSVALTIDTNAVPWSASPVPGIERRMLERDGEEVAVATSIVRYAPNSQFARHVHGGGEEFLVLSGIFSDERGHFGAGTYVRNPPGSSHQPRTGPGCEIFVKLHQFDAADHQFTVVDARRAAAVPAGVDGVQLVPLHANDTEDVFLLRFAAPAEIALDNDRATVEILFLDGEFVLDGDALGPRFWARRPRGPERPLLAGRAGEVFVKRRLNDPLARSR